jgi:hypothetical protein
MKRTHLLGQASGLALAVVIAALTASCQKTAPAAPASVDQAPAPVATLPLSDAPAPAMAAAPPLAALPSHPVRRVAVARPQDSYAFADRAHQVTQSFGDAPPDYAFDYQGVRPWSWRGDNGYQTVAEPLPGGGERYYYYQPGSDAPFYVRDPDYAYGYQGGALVVVYDRFGRPLAAPDQDRRADDAGRYLWRAQALYQASLRERHQAVARANWEARRAEIGRERAEWLANRDRNPDWRAYHDQYGQQDQAGWAQERYRREAEAARVDQANHNAVQAARERQAALAAVGVAGGGVASAAWMAGHHTPVDLTPAQMAARRAQAQAAQQQQDLAAKQAQARTQALTTRQNQLATRQAAQAQAAAAQAQMQNRARAAQQAELRAKQAADQTAARQVQARQEQAAARVQALHQQQAQAADQAAARKAQADARQQQAAAQKAVADRQAQVAAQKAQAEARQHAVAAHQAQVQQQTADRAAALAKRQADAAKARAAREAARKMADKPVNATP